ncbi:alanine--tRNA ligase [Candidatus Shapirobacteria bacterium]|nr:alanine--tRNA ligase [Candidatus Shapirobacteria bacterium]
MKAVLLKKKYLTFFLKKSHQVLPNVSLLPENDPTALFINSGMHPLVPYLLAEVHPLGKRLVSNQRCLRTQDIEKIGNLSHLTFFEMLGNWSLGDYWKKEAIEWSWEFLTKELGLEEKRISVSCFTGDKDAPKDEESAKIWQALGIPAPRIYFFGKDDNWWSVGETGPCGPDTEMFYDTGQKACGSGCRPGCHCGKYFEIWNDVFMEFNRLPNGRLEKLKQKNIDTGMGVERTTAMLQSKNDVYQTELFSGLINQIEEISGKKYEKDNQKAMRIIADHLRAATFAMADGVEPSNTEAGYVVRRLIRRAIRYGRQLKINQLFAFKMAKVVIDDYSEEYPHLRENKELILNQLQNEEEKFLKTLARGLKEINKLTAGLIGKTKKISGQKAFYLYETYGFPLELTEEMAKEKGLTVDKDDFLKAQLKHQQKSKTSLTKKFAGGLVDHSQAVTKLHTATHLLHQALRQVLGEKVQQVGSNITPERLRFDFTHSEKLTAGQIRKVEDLVNEQIKKNLPVKMEMMSLTEAQTRGALAFFKERYGSQVKVYFLGDFSKEVCGGPHVNSLGEIGGVKIVKEESVGTGRRRLYARLE